MTRIILNNSKIWASEDFFLSPSSSLLHVLQVFLQITFSERPSWYILFYIINLPHPSSIESPSPPQFILTYSVIVHFTYFLSLPIRMWAPWEQGFFIGSPTSVSLEPRMVHGTWWVLKHLLNKWIDKRRWLILWIKKK